MAAQKRQLPHKTSAPNDLFRQDTQPRRPTPTTKYLAPSRTSTWPHEYLAPRERAQSAIETGSRVTVDGWARVRASDAREGTWHLGWAAQRGTWHLGWAP